MAFEIRLTGEQLRKVILLGLKEETFQYPYYIGNIADLKMRVYRGNGGEPCVIFAKTRTRTKK